MVVILPRFDPYGMAHIIWPILYMNHMERKFKTVVMLFLSPHMILKSESEYENAGISARQSF